MDLDPTTLNFSNFLVDQAAAKVEVCFTSLIDSASKDVPCAISQSEYQAFGSNFFGIAIDRLDHLSMWNNNAFPKYDDGLAWCGTPCYPLMR